MSAYIVSDDTAIVVAVWATKTDRALPTVADVTAAYHELVAENYISVNHRYRENEGPHPAPKITDGMIMAAMDLAPGKVNGAIRNYNYQACETSEYPASKAAKMVAAAGKALLDRLAPIDGHWGLDEGELAKLDCGAVSLMSLIK